MSKLCFEYISLAIPGGASGKELTCQCRRHKKHRFSPWVGKIPGAKHSNSSILIGKSPWTEEPGGP